MLATIAGLVLGFLLDSGLDRVFPYPAGFELPAWKGNLAGIGLAIGAASDLALLTASRRGPLPHLFWRRLFVPIAMVVGFATVCASFASFTAFGSGQLVATERERGEIRAVRQALDKKSLDPNEANEKIAKLQARIDARKSGGSAPGGSRATEREAAEIASLREAMNQSTIDPADAKQKMARLQASIDGRVDDGRSRLRARNAAPVGALLGASFAIVLCLLWVRRERLLASLPGTASLPDNAAVPV